LRKETKSEKFQKTKKKVQKTGQRREERNSEEIKPN
jgi:hypothetical protein